MAVRNVLPTSASPDLLHVDFLSVNAVVGVAGHMALSVTRKRHTSEITLNEERIGTQWQVLILILADPRP